MHLWLEQITYMKNKLWGNILVSPVLISHQKWFFLHLKMSSNWWSIKTIRTYLAFPQLQQTVRGDLCTVILREPIFFSSNVTAVLRFFFLFWKALFVTQLPGMSWPSKTTSGTPRSGPLNGTAPSCGRHYFNKAPNFNSRIDLMSYWSMNMK